MKHDGWTWANLNQEQLDKIENAEKTLGNNVRYLVAYEPGKSFIEISPNRMQISTLNESQVECLQGLESQLHTVVVAYQ